MDIKAGNNEAVFSFSWIKECNPHSYSFSVGTSLESMMALLNKDNISFIYFLSYLIYLS